MNDSDILTDSIVKGLAYAENGGKLDIANPSAGKTGETKSIFQFTPATWKNYSRQVFGSEKPMNADTETYVVRQKVKKWVDQGRTTSQIASMWNAGEGRPDAYKQGWKGMNTKYGVSYDTPAYASKVLKYSKQFYQEKKSNSNQGGQQGNDALKPIVSMMQQSKEKPQGQSNGLLNPIVSMIKSASNSSNNNNAPQSNK